MRATITADAAAVANITLSARCPHRRNYDDQRLPLVAWFVRVASLSVCLSLSLSLCLCLEVCLTVPLSVSVCLSLSLSLSLSLAVCLSLSLCLCLSLSLSPPPPLSHSPASLCCGDETGITYTKPHCRCFSCTHLYIWCLQFV